VIPPIEHQVRVAVPPATAFDLWVRRIGEWWDPRYTRDATTLRTVTIEPFVGGRVFATHDDGEDVWGEVHQWEPGGLLVHDFWLAHDPAHPSEVRVEFEPAGEGCVLRFVHRGWNEGNVAVRGKFADWPVMLERYRALVGS
jgi:hypothetical protein